MTVSLHPLIDKGFAKKSARFKGGTLVCNCVSNPIRVQVTGQVQHNHACGCTRCWKPKGAAFSIVAVVPSGDVAVIEGRSKLKVVDRKALIQRHACRACGTHIHGPVEQEHPFQGLTFIHPELFEETGWAPPTFVAFVSSVIESGVDPGKMKSIRTRLTKAGLEPYDCLSPALMDYIATWTARKSGALSA
ncbi:MAG: S-(hydroxymethyl)glutathione synthase [Mesorhizobium sp.]